MAQEKEISVNEKQKEEANRLWLLLVAARADLGMLLQKQAEVLQQANEKEKALSDYVSHLAKDMQIDNNAYTYLTDVGKFVQKS